MLRAPFAFPATAPGRLSSSAGRSSSDPSTDRYTGSGRPRRCPCPGPDMRGRCAGMGCRMPPAWCAQQDRCDRKLSHSYLQQNPLEGFQPLLERKNGRSRGAVALRAVASTRENRGISGTIVPENDESPHSRYRRIHGFALANARQQRARQPRRPPPGDRRRRPGHCRSRPASAQMARQFRGIASRAIAGL